MMIRLGAAVALGTIAFVQVGTQQPPTQQPPTQETRTAVVAGDRASVDAFLKSYVDAFNKKDVKALAAMWARVGLDVKVDAMPKAQYFQRTPKKEFSAAMQGWGDNNRDAMFTLKPLYHSLNEKGAGDTNYGNFRNAELDDLIDRAEVEMDAAKRQALINQAVQVLQREVLVIPLHRQVIPWVTRSNIRIVHRSDNKLAPLWVRVD